LNRVSHPNLSPFTELSAGSIASISIAIIGVLALAIGVLFFLRHRRRRASNRYSTGSWEDGPFYREKGAVPAIQGKLYSQLSEVESLNIYRPETLGAPNTVRPIFETSNQLGNYGGVAAQEPTGVRRGAANSIRSNSSRSFRSYFPSSAWDQPKRKSVSASLRGLIAPLERSYQTS
jgi:LPXTG-motif cell wall-anchored protein